MLPGVLPTDGGHVLVCGDRDFEGVQTDPSRGHAVRLLAVARPQKAERLEVQTEEAHL